MLLIFICVRAMLILLSYKLCGDEWQGTLGSLDQEHRPVNQDGPFPYYTDIKNQILIPFMHLEG